MKLTIDKERQKLLIDGIKEYVKHHFDEDIGDLKARLLLDFFTERLGPTIYNQALHDAQAYMQDKLLDLEGDLHQSER